MRSELDFKGSTVSGPRAALRLVVIIALIGVELVRTLPTTLMVRMVKGRSQSRERLYRGLVRLLQTLGPTFVKFGQIASTRRDTMPAELCEQMGRLHDRVTPMSWAEAGRALADAQALCPKLALQHVDQTPVGSGSIACVYRARLADGRVVALKLKRPDVDRRIRTDLALLQRLVRIAERMPKMRGMPMADLVGYLNAAILGQLDFGREADNLDLLRDSISGMPDVLTPMLYRELSGPNCLVFDFIADLDAATPALLPGPVRARLGTAVLTAAHRMMFVHGFVHCDLHPGNLYLTRDEHVVILDAGYCVRLPARVRDLIGEFFGRLAVGDGRRCGEIVLESAVAVGSATNREAFITEMVQLVSRTAGPGNTFDMSVFGNEVFELQQRHGIYAASDFAFPLMSLLVLEGTVRGMWPAVDFQQVGTAAAPDLPDHELATWDS
ncbi:hypothetical protein GCM10027290_47650 [Micromonospora sonneratiae]|uniref:ABC1 kinase family protein n=1 Tax=Micromonospora sonneratiae TaxID=1184706 RepID=A0ABW3YAT2_9ACTN